MIKILNAQESKKVWANSNHNDYCLFYPGNGCRYICRIDDIPDAIMAATEEDGFAAVTFTDFFDNLLCNTFGQLLNKADPEIRKRIIDRLISLQMYEEEPRDIELIDEELLESNELESRNEQKIELLKAMDLIVRHMNNEEAYCYWIEEGVPDEASEDDYEFIASDIESLNDVTTAFEKVMKWYIKDGIYIGGLE